MRNWILIAAAAAATIPGISLELGLYHPDAPARAVIFGVAIIGAAFLLSWAAEAFQVDVSQGLALGLLALIAVLPEYIVDGTFAWQAANDPEYAQFAVANMTGANRLLIGVAWPMVVAIGWFRFRQTYVRLDRGHGLELIVLLVASIYAVTIPFKGEISLLDFVILAAIFGFYIWRLSKLPAERPHLAGPAAAIASLATVPRRLTTGGVALAAAVAILFVAEPFAEALIESGGELGIDEFLLVQWLAPLASEAPEFVVVALFAWRGGATAAMSTLVSSKINQWTLLVGMLPLIYSISLGEVAGLPLDERQQQELFMTAAQTLAAVMFLLDLRFHWYGALILFGLFVAQFFWPDHLLVFTFIYFGLAVFAGIHQRRAIGIVLRDTRSSLGMSSSSQSEP
ncbi:MAG: Sodium/calcium exchanger family protein [uncultured Chloroflexia bacterium]|uniref:Sodium/calcium exchanger family protein n=1 Tax=uncultured Chloroflexia bacterium TaxID=1672391 RepID=A0A6J4JHX9_9CHLR|nr:MAG: Sodium/calcium exchanger family protein [uncultured Chloroflexia bacterium]